ASVDPDQIRGWWQLEPKANIGLTTGGGFDVLDVDSADALVTTLTYLSPDLLIEIPHL
ncbi:MAG: bifunctional DNA primase/polymerase, partial [Acidimicrobiales bacterium]